MKTVAILAFDYAFASSITGPLDIFTSAGLAWNKIHGLPIRSLFNVEVVSARPGPVSCISKLIIHPQRTISSRFTPDIILIPAIGGNILTTLSRQQAAIAWIKRCHDQGSLIVAHGAGSFLVAESGILDGKSATTFWGAASLFRQRYPKIKLKSDLLSTSDRKIVCSAGGAAWLTVCLEVVASSAGEVAARQCAKALAINLENGLHAVYSSLVNYKSHQDSDVQRVQAWIEKNFSDKIDLTVLADNSGMSSRTLHRRFLAATGIPPLRFLQLVRLESAKHHLETSLSSLEQIVDKVGYQDSSSFVRLFRKTMGVTPAQYRARFHGARRE